jgi:hypothetical protein
MTHTDLTLRILNGLFWSVGPYLYWRRELRKEQEKRAIQDRLDQVIRGGR